MQGKKEDIEIDESITYSLVSDTFSKSLKLHNKSPHIYVFKVVIIRFRSRPISVRSSPCS